MTKNEKNLDKCDFAIHTEEGLEKCGKPSVISRLGDESDFHLCELHRDEICFIRGCFRQGVHKCICGNISCIDHHCLCEKSTDL